MIYSKDGILDKNFKVVSEEEKTNYIEEAELRESLNNTEVFIKPKGDIWFTIIPDAVYNKLRRMRNSNISIKTWSKNNVKSSLITGFACLMLGLTINKLMFIGALILPIYMYFTKLQSANNMFNQWQFERRIQFSKFSRLLIPYLKRTAGGTSLHYIFGKVAERLDNKQDRDLLNILRKEMSDNPGEVAPFIKYAEQASGTDMSVLFMSTLFDIRQGAVDMSIIDELGQMATAQLMDGINQIITFKTKKFTYFSTILTFMNLIIVLGFGVGITWYTVMETGIVQLFGAM